MVAVVVGAGVVDVVGAAVVEVVGGGVVMVAVVVGAGVGAAVVEVVVATAQEPVMALAQQSLAEFNVPVNPVLHLQSERASAPVLSLVNKLLVISVLELSGQSVQACDPASGLYLPSAHAVQPLSGPVYPDAHEVPVSIHVWQLGVTVEALMLLHMQTICRLLDFLSLHCAALRGALLKKSSTVVEVLLPQAPSMSLLLFFDMRARRHVVPTCSLHT